MIAVLSLLTAMAAVSVRYPIAEAQRGQVISQIQALDSVARIRSGSKETPFLLVLSPREGRIELRDRSGQLISNHIVLPSPIKLIAVLGNATKRNGEYLVEFDSFGTSSDYACLIGSETGKQEWLVVLGMTGQCYLMEKESNVRTLVRSRSTRALSQQP